MPIGHIYRGLNASGPKEVSSFQSGLTTNIPVSEEQFMASGIVTLADLQSRTTIDDNGCWNWLRAMYPNGYGIVSFNGKTCGAHRVAWTVARGPIPGGLCVLHRCDNRRCVNPDHLWLGTKGDNARDMAAKGRQWFQVHPELAYRPRETHPHTTARGIRHGNAKFTEADVRTIRELYRARHSQASIARQFNVSEFAIYAIVHGISWKHLKE